VSEVPIIAWIAALVFAALVLTFCGYEVWWKARRLQTDLARLEALDEQVRRLQADIEDARARAVRAVRD
jgi:hypothetical protein